MKSSLQRRTRVLMIMIVESTLMKMMTELKKGGGEGEGEGERG